MERKNCHYCSKKIKLVEQIQCKCGHYFCSLHRHFDVHKCKFDYKANQDTNNLGLGGGSFRKIEKI